MQQTTDNQQHMTNNKKQTTHNTQHTTNNRQQTTDKWHNTQEVTYNKQHTTCICSTNDWTGQLPLQKYEYDIIMHADGDILQITTKK